jgi:hypothetical protein
MSITQAAGSVVLPRTHRLSRALCAAAILAAAVVALPSVATEPADAATVIRPPTSIDTTGTRDVTAELQAFLAKVPNHSTISFPAGAKYRAEGTLALRRKNDIVVEGNGATFFATKISDVRDKPQWVIDNLSNIVFADMTIRGTHPNGGQDDDAYVAAREAQHGVLVQGGERIELRNLKISDVFGDFIYVGRSPAPTFGHPENVWIHDNVMRRNGRQGISVTDATNVVIERNNIADTRRATFDFEPLDNWSVQNVWLRNNTVGPGRLMFVAGHGAGDFSNVHIENNTLAGHSLGIDLAAEAGERRSNVWISGNKSDTPEANPRGTLMRFVSYDNVDVRNNANPIPDNRQMSTVGSYNSCNVTSVNNDLGPNKVSELVTLANTYDCSQLRAVAGPAATPAKFSGQRLAIDVGGPGSAKWGILGCGTASRCNGYIVSGTAKPILAASVAGYSAWGGIVYRSMLEGDPHFAIPIRTGTYDVKLSFVEPTYDQLSQRRFHFDVERQRMEAGFDVFRMAGGKDKLLNRTYRITVGDGALNIDFINGPQPAVLSFITITRA